MARPFQHEDSITKQYGGLGISDNVRRGFQQIRAQFRIKSDSSAEQLQELTKFSPVYDTIANPVTVSISIEPA